jgi:hypothetical protein
MQQQQAQSQQQEKLDNAKIMQAFSKSKVDMAKEQDLMASVQERMAKIQDLHSDSEYKSSKADLEMVRTMIELEDLDLANFKTNLELAEYIKGVNKASQQISAMTG